MSHNGAVAQQSNVAAEQVTGEVQPAAEAPKATPAQIPDFQGGADAAPISSTGTWGETQRGRPVDPSRAREDFELARLASRQRSTTSRDSGFVGGGSIAQMLSGASRRPKNLDKAVEEGAEPAAEKTDAKDHLAASDEDFDLGAWIRSRFAQQQQQGVNSKKPLGLSWRDVSISAPGGGGGGVFVKTVPQAIINTATNDPLGILAKLIPGFGKLLSKASGLQQTPLLHPTSGVLRSGEMVLVIGRPGSGCTTFLKALTSSSDSNVAQGGSISYSGLSPADINKRYRGEVVFSGEDDIHFATITVGQTLKFALRNKVPTRKARLQGESRDDFIETIVSLLLKMFNMSHVRDTIVGDAAVRGVSGGERKRVTLSEALITRASVIAFDNATRGLDASTALEYARSLRIITDLAERTTIATLYQVSESIFDLFDRVAVVDEGRVIYYGPRDQTRSYFEALGYYTPERQTTSDFCTALVDPDQVQYKEGFEKRAPRTAEDRERAWRDSHLYKALLDETSEYEAATVDAEHAQTLGTVTANEKNTGVKPSSPYTVSFWQQTKACMWRQLLIQWSTREDMYLKLFTIITINLVIGALFFGQSRDSTGVFTRGGVLLFATLLNGWLQLEVAFSAVAGRPMLARHRTFAFHRPAAVSLARAIIDIPFLAVQCLLTTIILYWMANLRADAGAFFYFFLVVFLCAYNLTALYRAIASLVPGFNEAIRFSVMALNIIIMTIGYVIRRPQMNWTIFLNYISGIPYAFEALLVNELVGPIPCNPSQIVPFNEARDVTYQTCAITGAQPGSLDTPSQDYLYTTFRYQSRTRGYNWAVVLAFTILYLLITLVAVEKLDWTAGGGGITIWARTKEAKRRLAGGATEPARKDDPEATPVNPSRSGSGQESDDTRANSPEQAARDADAGKKALDKWNDKAIFTWSDINLTLDNGRKLLHEVDGWVRPGQMTALLGQSGAGKTTLMTALSQRGAAGHLTGEMLVDGKPIDKAFSKGTGLVLQGDMHLATQTVREAIEFSALLRQPADVTRADKLAHAQEVIETLELESLSDALIGMPGAGLSIEKRKRVTIGVELAAKPDLLLFLDEPTSGLDSAGAAAIIRLLRRLASEGQAILCTIHQPSALLFESFDNVLLLKPGGEVTFFGQTGDVAGKGSERIRRYFESQGAPECHPAQNVAEYILEVVGGSLGRGIDWGKKWRESKDSQDVRSEIQTIVGERSQRPNKVASRDLREYSATTYEQIRVLVQRQLRDAWRDSAFTYGLLFSHFLVALLSGGIFYGLNTSPVDLQNRVFVVFLILLNVPAVVNAIISKFFELRVLFEARESPSKIYAWYSLIAAFLIALTPVAVLCAVIYFVPGFFLPYGKQPTYVAGFFFLNTLTVVYFFILFALILVGSCPSPVIAAELLPFLLPILAICNGVIVPRASMPQPFKSLVYYANPIAYYVQAQVSTIMHPLRVLCEREDLAIFNPPPGQTCEAYAGAWAQSAGGYLSNPNASAECGFCQYREGSQFAMTLNADYSFRWQAWGILLGFTIFNLFFVFFGYWWMNVKGYGIGVAASKSAAARAWRSVRKSKK